MTYNTRSLWAEAEAKDLRRWKYSTGIPSRRKFSNPISYAAALNTDFPEANERIYKIIDQLKTGTWEKHPILKDRNIRGRGSWATTMLRQLEKKLIIEARAEHD